MKKNKTYSLLIAFLLLFLNTVSATRQMEFLNRGLVAVKVSTGVYLSWRFLGTDSASTVFNIYRNNIKINATPISGSTNYSDASGTTSSSYKVIPVINGFEDTTGVKTVLPWAQAYKTIPLRRPARGITPPNKTGSVGKAVDADYPNGQPYGYSPNDCSVGDLDGDGEYEIIVKWDPSNSQDNSYYGITGNVFLDAYKLDGTFLWRIDLGKNIRAGAHYTQFLVYDFDGDGLSELICKTAPGTIDGAGNYVLMNNDSPTADYRNLDVTQTSGSRMLGTIQTGSEYLTLFDGRTGANLHTITYNPLRNSASWGDSYANRSDRFLACVAYLDGVHPSAVMCRGYYTRATLASYDVVGKKLVQRWFYDSGTTAGVGAYGQGNHNLSVADVDSDDKDEVVYSSCVIDDNGKLLYRTGLGHGDAMHVSDMDLDNPGLEVWVAHEEVAMPYGYELHDAKTGKILWGGDASVDVGRGMAGDIDARYPGFEMWTTANNNTYTSKGAIISSNKPSVNFRIYWDGDLQDELLDGTVISKWNGNGVNTLLSASGVSSCNSTKKTPNLSADILGDWREELILWTTADSSKIQIYTTTTPTTNRLFTLMHDTVYRLAIAWQNAAYNQPPHLGFYIGGGLVNVVQPDISTKRYASVPVGLQHPMENKLEVWGNSEGLTIQSFSNIQSIDIFSVTGQLIFRKNNIESMIQELKLAVKNQLLIIRVKNAMGIETCKIMH
ncbi:MAG TPA: rhamnogalacturonan lyase [Bacteroidales bacterium]|nr:rhamnogalacturonan lyase [Bacteroidales bacterium]